MKVTIISEIPILSRDEHREVFGALGDALRDFAECDFSLEEGYSENCFVANLYPENSDFEGAMDWVFEAITFLYGRGYRFRVMQIETV